MKKPILHFRWFIILLVSFFSAITLAVTGSGIFLYRDAEISGETIRTSGLFVQSLAERTEGMLASVEQSLITLTYASLMLDEKDFSILIESTLRSQPLIRAMYFLNDDGKTFAIWTKDVKNPRDPDYLGIDFSFTPLYKNLKNQSQPVWSAKFVSTFSGDTSIGVGIQIGNKAAIAELELSTLLQTVETVSGSGARLWIIDRYGEVLVDTGQSNLTGVLNIRNEPIISLAFESRQLPATVQLFGASYHPAAALSKKLGWLFLAGIPAGLANPGISNVLKEVLLFSASFLLVALVLSPLWSRLISRQLDTLKQLADRIAEGKEAPARKQGFIQEFNELGDYLRDMSDRVIDRENALRILNQELEQRVMERTRELADSNQELQESLDHNNRIRDLLVHTEKLAALGRLVAGIAHELNTPVGNAVMAISTMKESQKSFIVKMEEGLRKSDLDGFLEQTEQGLQIAERNIERAAELISSFKHVASDQTSSVRRKFQISEVVRDVVLTLHPMMKRSPHKLETDIEDNLTVDSYPGVISQIITNLITNAILHAWDEGESGTITVTARQSAENGRLMISVADDGRGIPDSIRAKIFDPFYTTKMGRGGTGLGLNIAQNGAANVLGGNLDFSSEEGRGTVFELDIPLVAPVIQETNQKEA